MHKYVIRRLLLAVPVLMAKLRRDLDLDTLRDAWDPKLRRRG